MAGPSKFLQWALDDIQRHLMARDDKARKVVQTQIDLVAAKKEFFQPPHHRYEPLNSSSISLQPHTMEVHAALVFYCDDKVTSKIRGMKTETGHVLVNESMLPDGRKNLSIWNEAEQRRDGYEEIYACRDPQTGTQFAAYYDVSNNILSFNFGGTDFTNFNDIKTVAQTLEGVVDMRMTDVKPYIDRAMKVFNEKYPGKLPDTPVDIYSHSAGANEIPLANYFLRSEYNIEPRAQVMLDPFGSRNSFTNISEMIATAEGRPAADVLAELSKNVMSYKVKTGTFIDHLAFLDVYDHAGPGHADETIGPVEKLPIKGNLLTAHLAKSWIKYFNAVETARVQMIKGAAPADASAPPAKPPSNLAPKPAV